MGRHAGKGTLMKYSLSTMWAQQERFADMHDFVRAAREFGFDAIEVSHTTDVRAFGRLIDGVSATLKGGPRTKISSIHAPAPKVEVKGKINSSLNLASLDG